MPSIRQIMGVPDELEGGDTEFDLDKFMADVDGLIPKSNDRLRGPDAGPEPSPEPTTAAAPEPDEDPVLGEQEPGDEAEGEPEPEVPLPPAPAALAPPDPLAAIPAERRAALLALDEVFQRDPAKAESVLRGLSTDPALAPVAAPQLPEDFDPGSPEARLWQQQQDTAEQIRQLTAATRAQQETFAKQQANTAAQQAGATFAARYQGRLDEADVVAIAKQAGESGLAGVLAGTPEGRSDLASAYDRALETTLWSNEVYRAKVLELTPTGPAPKTPETKSRQRKLTALSSAASPVSGPSPKRSPLESRSDGRLTPQSRMGLVKELASNLNRSTVSEEAI